jgi:hypothetical protein
MSGGCEKARLMAVSKTMAIDRSRPYRVEGRTFIQHVPRKTRVIAVDDSAWRASKKRVDKLVFRFADGSVMAISAAEFERRSRLRGSRRMPLRLISLSDLERG